MSFLENMKLVAELVTSTVAAIILVIHLLKQCRPIKMFFKTTIPLFFKGDIDINGKRIRFCKGIKYYREKNIAIIKAISTNSETEEVLVLDKNAFYDILSKSGAFKTIRLHK